MKPLWHGETNIYSNGPGHLTKVAAIAIYTCMVKPIQKFSQKQNGRWPWNLVCSNCDLGPTKFVQMITLGWPWPVLHQGQVWSFRLLYGKRPNSGFLRFCCSLWHQSWYMQTVKWTFKDTKGQGHLLTFIYGHDHQSWSCDQGPMNKFSFFHPIQAPCVICFNQHSGLKGEVLSPFKPLCWLKQITRGACMGWKKENLFMGPWSHDQDWRSCPYMVKKTNPLKVFSWLTATLKLGMQHWELGPTRFVQMMTLGWPWPI